MKIIFPISSPLFTEVSLYGFFMTYAGYTCQKIAYNQYVAILDEEKKPIHISFEAPENGENFKIKRILKDSDITIQPLIFKDVEVSQFYQTNYGEVYQKVDYDMTQQITNGAGKLAVGSQQKISIRSEIEQIFKNLDQIEIQPEHQ